MTKETNLNTPAWLRIPATIISYLCHPVFLPTVMTYLLFLLAPTGMMAIPGAHMGIILIRIAYITAFFPLLTVLLLKGLGFVDSIMLHNPKERIIPMMATMIFYFWVYQVFKNLDAPLIMRSMLLGCFWGVITLFMVGIFFKVSLHTGAAGGMVGLMSILLFQSPVNMAIPFFVILFVAGLTGTARMILHAHTPGEIWLGYIVGLIAQWAAFLYLS
jgi:hypothetical protein